MSDKLATWINRKIEENGWSLREMGRQAKISHTHAARIANGEVTPSAETCQNIAHAFNVPAETVFRLAGYLPPLAEDTSPMAFIREVTDILKRLSIEDREYIYEMAKLHYARAQEKRTSYANTPTHAHDPTAP